MELPAVLVAEDDDQVQAIIEDALSEGGFDVATVATAEEGLALITRRADQYKALLTDIKLQGQMTGWELAKRAREIVPTLPVVYMTGDAAHEWPSQGVAREHPSAKAVCSSSGSNSHYHVAQQVVLATP